MGQGYVFRCASCGHEENLIQGESFMLHGLSVKEYLDHPFLKFHHSTHKKILRLKEKIRDLKIFSTAKGYVCPSCNIPTSKLYVEVYRDGRTYHQSYFRCRNCNRELAEKKIRLSNVYRCPKCLEETFIFNGAFIQWD